MPSQVPNTRAMVSVDHRPPLRLVYPPGLVRERDTRTLLYQRK